MKKKYYTIFFASEQNQYGRSFRLSKNKIVLLSFFGIILICLAIIGVNSFRNDYLQKQKVKGLNNDYLLLNNIISDLNYSMDSDTSVNYEHFISEFYKMHNLAYPDLPPVKGYVTRGLQIENNHLGIDIAAKNKDEVRSPAMGRVVFAGRSEFFGKVIIINHLGGFITVFGHNDSILVQSGEEVSKNQVISYVGETGNSEGPHLHYEIWKNNQILDPREIVLEYKKKDVSIGENRK